jgi:hypothetical protein
MSRRIEMTRQELWELVWSMLLSGPRLGGRQLNCKGQPSL